MLESSFFLYLILLFYGTGRALLYSIRWKDNEFLFTLSSCIGVIVITIAVTWYYRLGGRLNHFFWIVSILAVSFLLFRLIRHPNIWQTIASARVQLLTAVGFSVLTLLPGLLGGQQFTIFRGNQWDSFNYLEAAITYQGLPYAQVKHLNAAELVSHGLFQFGHDNLLYRPEVTFLYGMLSSYHFEAFLRLHYFLLIYFQFLAFCVVRVLAAELLSNRRIVPCLLAAAVVGGFWGQYILDIDAWSQNSCMPLIVLSLLLLVKITQAANPIERRHVTEKLIILYALVWVGMFYLYPEAAGFVLPAHVLCWVVAIRFLNLRVNWRFTGLTAIAALGLLLPVVRSNLLFLSWQATRTLNVDWWTYYQAFLFGHGAMYRDLFSKGADFIAGALGIYFVTPDPETDPLMAAIVRSLVVLGAVALFLKLVRQGRSVFSPSWLLLLLHLGVSLFIISVYCLFCHYWNAGKAFSFIAYFLQLLLIASALRTSAPDRSLVNRIAAATAVSLLALQVTFLCYRPFASRSPFGIHYSAPYPAIQDPNLKKTINFADWSFLRYLKSTDKVGLDAEDRFTQAFARILLRSHRIKFYLVAPAFDVKGGLDGKRAYPDATGWLTTTKVAKGPFSFRLNFQRTVDPP